MRKIGRPRINDERLSDEFLINKLKEAFAILGRTPKFLEIKKDATFPNTGMYEDRFVSWAKALDMAGIPRRNPRRRKEGDVIPNQRATLKIRFEILKRDNFTCQYCGRTPKDGAKLQVDHRLAVANGGDRTYENFITTCFECNIGKRDTLLSEYQAKKTKKG